MTMTRRGNNAASLAGWLSRRGLPVLRRLCAPIVALTLGFTLAPSSFALSGPHGFHQTSHPAPAPHASAPPPAARPAPQNHPNQNHPNGAAPHSGGQHLPEWWSNHRNLTPQQQADALRREPGFRDLPEDQQQRLINRLHSLDEKTPEQQQRIMQRNENFERLSPERRQEVRGASQALSQMSPDRQQVVRRAFQQLRRMPPGQRQQLLGSQVYGGQFSPQERTVLGNLLSIEPYQPRIVQPYFGR
jgi:Protein of unknown function (DUF3106)